MITVPISRIVEFLNPPYYGGMQVIINEHVTKETISYKYLYPIIGGHIWIRGSILRDAIVIIDSSITGQPVALMNQTTWNSIKDDFYEGS